MFVCAINYTENDFTHDVMYRMSRCGAKTEFLALNPPAGLSVIDAVEVNKKEWFCCSW